MLDLNTFDAIFLDLDGTLYHDDEALPGAVELIKKLQQFGRPFACLSNSTSSPSFIAARLDRLGMPVAFEQLYPASAAACSYVLARYGKDRPARVFNCGTDAVRELLTGRVRFVDNSEGACDAVVVGTPGCAFATPARQRIAVELLRCGAALIGVCADRVYPSSAGIEIGAGSLTTMLAYAANVTPTFCGKPEAIFFHELCTRMNVSAEKCVLIGDNTEADIAGGKNVGMKTILTLTGITRRDDVASLPEDQQPDEVIESLADIVGRIRQV